MGFKLWRRPAKPKLRYFVYVSDAKLEQLFQQIKVIDPKLLERLSAEAKVDLKVASLTIKTAPEPAATRMAKLIVVERYIDYHTPVGTVQKPGSEYFRGRMPLRWGWLRDPYSPNGPHDGFNVAFFRGERDGQTVVLVGSRHHVLGEQPLSANADVWPYSQEPTIVRVIAKHVSDLHETAIMFDREGEESEEDRALDEALGIDPARKAALREERTAGEEAEALLDAVQVAYLSGPPRWMEFLAVPLFDDDILEHEDGTGTHAVLATPIYVAHADPE